MIQKKTAGCGVRTGGPDKNEDEKFYLPLVASSTFTGAVGWVAVQGCSTGMMSLGMGRSFGMG